MEKKTTHEQELRTKLESMSIRYGKILSRKEDADFTEWNKINSELKGILSQKKDELEFLKIKNKEIMALILAFNSVNIHIGTEQLLKIQGDIQERIKQLEEQTK